MFSKADLTCYHYDSMHQGNVEAAVTIWKKIQSYLKGFFSIKNNSHTN